MTVSETIQSIGDDAEKLEELYHTSHEDGAADAFKQAIVDRHTAAPDNLLYAAWYYRLQRHVAQARRMAIAWGWVIPLALANGLLFWWFSDDQRYMIEITNPHLQVVQRFLPAILLVAAPLSALFVLLYLAATGRKLWRWGALIGVLLLAAGGYVLLAYPQVGTRPFQEQYLTLMALHLPLLSLAGVGAFLVIGRWDPRNRVSFLVKSLEVIALGGVLFALLGLFTAITFSLFEVLDVKVPGMVLRLFIAGGGGLLPVVVVAVLYHPNLPPSAQPFDHSLYRFAAYLLRVLLLLSLLVLVVYIFFIPFNFRAPFEDRDVLITYNVMLFAVIALLLGVTFIDSSGKIPAPAWWLRPAVNAVAALTLVISLYALSAIIYRTALDRLTPNRLAFIGWNVVNIAILVLIFWMQFREKRSHWLQAIHRAYSNGTIIYAAWTVAVILAVPWLFGINQGKVENLPQRVQEIIFEEAEPILLKCATSPHIYLLDRGEKRWIDSVETLTDRGYEWRDIEFVSCNDLRAVPDGTPIPADAGPPPQP